MDLVEAFRRQIESFVATLLNAYTKQLAKQTEPIRPKEINDSVWRTVVLQGFEVAILDSPLLQRLRYVRQLGVAHWVYPAATHSRLEHSIGALHQLQRVLDALNSNHDPMDHPSSPAIEIDIVNLLRLAALCHDVGHGVMSHVSENAFRNLESVEGLLFELEGFFNDEDVQLSEAIAYFMIGSPAFKELIDTTQYQTRHRLPVKPTELLQRAIIGQLIHSRLPLLQELISGPFDVDKLDYMTRDAYMSGVPVVTDIDRLVRKIRLVEVPAERLPHEIASTIKHSHPTYHVQAISLSGARTLDELMIGRALLFDKVYRHQKVRACESMVAKIILSVARLCTDERVPLVPLFIADEELVRCERAAIQRAIGRELTDQEWDTELKAAREVARRLRERELFVRAYAYAHKLPGDPFANDPAQKSGLEALRRENGKPSGRQVMLDGVCLLLREMRLYGVNFAPHIGDDEFHHYIALDNPPQKSVAGEIARAYLVIHGNSLMKFRDDSADASPWSNAYAMTRDLGFVFSARELAPAVFLATEVFVRVTYDVRTPPSALIYSKTSASAVDTLRDQLTKFGFYDNKAPDLRAPVARLSKVDVTSRIDSIAWKLSEFQGLVTEGDEARAVKVTRERVLAWLQQFKSDDNVDAALRMLEAIRVVSRAEVQQAIREYLRTHPEFANAIFCPLGSPKDSSNIVTYFVDDLKLEFPDIAVSTLPQALAEPGSKPIAFVDDFLSTGKQAASIVYQWLDRALEAPLNEFHVAALSNEAISALRNRATGFVFAAGTEVGKNFLEKHLAALQLKPIVHVHLSSALPQAFNNTGIPYLNSTQRTSFQDTCEHIGSQLLTNYEGKTRSKEWIDERKLGYGNAAYLLVFPYNIPTASLTALWCTGNVDGFAWLPLIPRRTKK